MDVLWYDHDLSNTKYYIKAVKQLERICRATFEYDDWARRCKYRDATDCPICDENYYDYNSKCETHHHPKTLFDIVDELLSDHIYKNDLDETTGLSIVQEIMDKHTSQEVSYINLCKHCHKKYHDGHPEVINKMNNIFEKRVAKEQAKEVVEVHEPLIVSDSVETESSDDKFNELIVEIVEERVEERDKISTINNETSTGFIEIDI